MHFSFVLFSINDVMIVAERKDIHSCGGTLCGSVVCVCVCVCVRVCVCERACVYVYTHLHLTTCAMTTNTTCSDPKTTLTHVTLMAQAGPPPCHAMPCHALPLWPVAGMTGVPTHHPPLPPASPLSPTC